MASITSSALRDLSDQNAVGTRLGTSSNDVICFYGITSGIIRVNMIGTTSDSVLSSVAQPFTALAVNVTGGVSGSGWCYVSSAQANVVISAIAQLRLLGIIG